jgi:hypothetical protein
MRSIFCGKSSNVRRSIGPLALFAMIGMACGDAHAEIDGSRFSFGGFGTLGVARTSGGDERPLRHISQPKGITSHWSARNDSVLGLQASYRFNDSFSAVLQGTTFQRDDGSYNPKVTWAFLQYDVTPRFSLRLGRVGTEFLMGASARQVGYSYLPVRPAIDFYGIIPIESADGLDARLKWPLGEGTLSAEAFAGIASDNIPPYDLEGTKVLRGALGYDRGDWQFRYIYAQGRLSDDVPGVERLRTELKNWGAITNIPSATAAADALAFKHTYARYHSLGASYDDGLWQFQAMLNRITQGSTLMENQHAATLLAARRFGNVTPYASYTWAKSSRKKLDSGLPNLVPDFALINNGIAQAMGATHLHRKTATFGARWDFANQISLTGQVDFVRGSRSSVLLLEEGSHGDGKTNIFSLSLDFVF